MIKAVILDFYGVLYSNFNWGAIDERIQSNELKAQRFAHLKNQSNKGLLDNITFRSEVAKLAEDKKHPQQQAVLAHADINHDLIALVQELVPDAKLALLSNGNRPDVVRQLRECGFYEQFDAIFTSSDMHFLKPEKAAYIHAFKELGVKPEEAVIIDDSPRHCDATESYKFPTICFANNSETASALTKLNKTQ